MRTQSKTADEMEKEDMKKLENRITEEMNEANKKYRPIVLGCCVYSIFAKNGIDLSKATIVDVWD